jgi:pantoate--beta-alanine ligase
MTANTWPGADRAPELATVRTVAALRTRVRALRERGGSVGLVPTMGALHAGHLRLVARARAACDHVVASLFVNPKQFDRPDDLARYPRDEARDAAELAAAGCHLLFAPAPEVMYPEGFATSVRVAGVTETLEGAHRPGHFEGVATVVTKLLLQVLPDVAFFGEKDYQQLLTIQQLARDLDIPVAIEGVPTVREVDGLALASRNARLTAAQRRIAPALASGLYRAAETLADGETEAAPVLDRTAAELYRAGFDAVDYLALRDAATLAPLDRADRPARLLAAAWLGQTRLIDNVPVAEAPFQL